MGIGSRLKMGVDQAGIGNTAFKNPGSSGRFGINILSDPSAITLLISNLVVIALALAEGWSLAMLMLVYWCQSMVIGFFNILKILTWKAPVATNPDSILKEIRSEGEQKPGLNPLLLAGKVFLAGFFAVNYGAFHFGYLIFILGGFFATSPFSAPNAGAIDWLMVGATTAVFFGNHLFSFIYNLKKDGASEKNIMQIMFAPYARIIPMHLTIIFGTMLMIFFGNPTLATILFLSLKTAADMKMHADEHSNLEG